jgi:uncharacterized membrane protein
MTSDPVSTGLPRRVAAALAYAGWWVTGAIFLFIEQRDSYVRFHAAQSCIAFGAIALVVAALTGVAATSLMFMPRVFGFWAWMAGLSWLAGLGLWVVSMWNAATERRWRIPMVAEIADRFSVK